MNTVLKLSRHNVAASDAARRARQQRRIAYPRARSGCRFLTEREEWALFNTVNRARGKRP